METHFNFVFRGILVLGSDSAKGSKNAMILAAQTEKRDHELLKAMVPQNCFFSLLFNLPKIPTNFASLHRLSATSAGILAKVVTFVRSGTGYGISPKAAL